jgi:hypothetical protein
VAAGGRFDEEAADRERRHRHRPPWVHEEGAATLAECRVRRPFPCADEREGAAFDPARSSFYEIRLTPSSSSSLPEGTAAFSAETPGTEAERPTQLLHNTVVVLPGLLTKAECALIVRDAERILAANEAVGVRTEKWSLYGAFAPECRAVIDRALGRHLLAFLEARLPHVATTIFRRGGGPSGGGGGGGGSHGGEPVPTGMPMGYYWDDPVVIKYTAGNELAPHVDMRELTVVFPLNPLEYFPLAGGGTRFWLEGTEPDRAGRGDGVSLSPPPGSGIVFNGDIVHSGNSVRGGTRFVLMTSINLD